MVGRIPALLNWKTVPKITTSARVGDHIPPAGEIKVMEILYSRVKQKD